MARDISTRAMPGSLTRTFTPLHLPTLIPLTLSHGDPGEVPVGLLVPNSRVLTGLGGPVALAVKFSHPLMADGVCRGGQWMWHTAIPARGRQKKRR